MKKVVFTATTKDTLYQDVTSLLRCGFTIFNLSNAISNSRHSFKGYTNFKEMTFILPTPRIQSLYKTEGVDRFNADYIDYLSNELYIDFIDKIIGKSNKEVPLAFIVMEDDLEMGYPQLIKTILSKFSLATLDLEEFRSRMISKLDDDKMDNELSLNVMAMTICYGKKAGKRKEKELTDIIDKSNKKIKDVTFKTKPFETKIKDTGISDIQNNAIDILSGNGNLVDFFTGKEAIVDNIVMVASGEHKSNIDRIGDIIDETMAATLYQVEIGNTEVPNLPKEFNYDLGEFIVEVENKVTDGDEYGEVISEEDDIELERVKTMSYTELKAFIKKHKMKKPILEYFGSEKLKLIPFDMLKDYIYSNFFILKNV